MKDLIESGEYFKEARIWYNQIYLYVYPFRSIFAVFFILAGTSVFILILNIQALLPTNKQLRYSITVNNYSEDLSAQIVNVSEPNVSTYKSIAKIFLSIYVRTREGYDYENIENAMLYMRNSSTKVIYKQFSDFLNLNNPNSPLLRFQKYAVRKINIKKISFIDDNNVIITFNAITREDNGKLLEDSEWQANITFILDQIDLNLPENAPFNFTVSDYNTKFIKDNINGN